MSDLFGALTTASRSLDAHRYALEVVGHNLANVNTPGYTKRSAQLAEIPSLDGLGVGAGVEATGVEASRAPHLDYRLYLERPAAGRESAVAQSLAVLESAFGEPGTGIDARLNELFDAFASLATDPTSTVMRRLVTSRGQALGTAFNDLSTQLTEAGTDATTAIDGAITQINSLAENIAALNFDIAAGLGNTDGLEDRRTEALNQLAALVDVGVTTHSDGAIDVTVGNGRALVARDRTYAMTQSVGVVSVGSHDVSDEITGGQIGGFMQFRDVLLPDYETRLDALAEDVASEINTVHAAGYDLNGSTGQAFFVAVTGAGAAGDFAVHANILADPDAIAAAATTATGDNQVARDLADLRNDRPSLVDGWSSLVYRVGADHNNATAELETRQDVIKQLQSLKSQISGVSIDEEAATMLRFQRAYEANAQFFNVVNELLDVLMANVGR